MLEFVSEQEREAERGNQKSRQKGEKREMKKDERRHREKGEEGKHKRKRKLVEMQVPLSFLLYTYPHRSTSPLPCLRIVCDLGIS